MGNTSNQHLRRVLRHALPAALSLLDSGEALVEIAGGVVTEPSHRRRVVPASSPTTVPMPVDAPAPFSDVRDLSPDQLPYLNALARAHLTGDPALDGFFQHPWRQDGALGAGCGGRGHARPRPGTRSPTRWRSRTRTGRRPEPPGIGPPRPSPSSATRRAWRCGDGASSSGSSAGRSTRRTRRSARSSWRGGWRRKRGARACRCSGWRARTTTSRRSPRRNVLHGDDLQAVALPRRPAARGRPRRRRAAGGPRGPGAGRPRRRAPPHRVHRRRDGRAPRALGRRHVLARRLRANAPLDAWGGRQTPRPRHPRRPGDQRGCSSRSSNKKSPRPAPPPPPSSRRAGSSKRPASTLRSPRAPSTCSIWTRAPGGALDAEPDGDRVTVRGTGRTWTPTALTHAIAEDPEPVQPGRRAAAGGAGHALPDRRVRGRAGPRRRTGRSSGASTSGSACRCPPWRRGRA